MEETAQSLQIFQEALLNPITALWNQLAALLPNLLAALVLVLVGYFLGKFLALVSRKLLQRFGVDRLSQSTGLEQAVAETGIQATLSSILGGIFFWLIMLTFVLSAVNALGLPRLSETINEVVLYIPKVIGAALVGLVGLFAAHAVRKTVQAAGQRARLTYTKPLSSFLYALLLLVTLSLAFGQLELEVGLLNQLLTIIVLTMGVAVALSLGLGTRDISANIIAGYYARELHRPGSHIQCGGISGEVISVGKTKTLVRGDNDQTIAISNRQLLDETTVSQGS
jgi:small-conductance mechanosensitive channel